MKRFCAEARAAGALSYVDAVQFAPHGLIDVMDLGCDFLVSSAYKWFGPHMGILWGLRERLQQTFGYKVRPAGEDLPHKFETGTLSHEGMAGCLGAVEYLASLGTGEGRRARLVSAWKAMEAYEQSLTQRLIDGIGPLQGLARCAASPPPTPCTAGCPQCPLRWKVWSQRNWQSTLRVKTSSSGRATTTPSSPAPAWG